MRHRPTGTSSKKHQIFVGAFLAASEISMMTMIQEIIVIETNHLLKMKPVMSRQLEPKQ